MKPNSTYSFILMLLSMAATGCNPNTKAIHSYPELAVEIKKPDNGQEIATAQKEANSDFQKFVREARGKIDRSSHTISGLKMQVESESNETRDINLGKIERFEKTNENLKIALDNYVLNGNGNWQLFKSALYGHLDDLESAVNSMP